MTLILKADPVTTSLDSLPPRPDNAQCNTRTAQESRTMAQQWTIDTRNRSATSSAGDVVQFERENGIWSATPANTSALNAWNAALDEGVAMLVRVGETLYGKEWRYSLATDMGLGRNTPMQWENGKTPLSMQHTVWPEVADLLEAKAHALNALAKEIRKATK